MRRIVVSDSRVLTRASGLDILGPRDYLDGHDAAGRRIPTGALCYNLCRDFGLRRSGYYVSLIGMSRGQRVLPSTGHVDDLRYRSYFVRMLREAGIPTPTLKISAGGTRWSPRIEPDPEKARRLTVDAVFGKVRQRSVAGLCRDVWGCFPLPLLRIDLYRRTSGRDRRWKVVDLKIPSPSELAEQDLAALVRALEDPALPAPAPRRRKAATFHWLACLWDPEEKLQPSGEETIEHLERVAARKNVHVGLIGPRELARLPEYDALFIRKTTGLDDITFQFAKMAETFGMPVIDDPESVVRCTDKVFLHELFLRNDVPTPATRVLQERDPEEKLASLGFPLILKSPGGSFSRAVKKAEDLDEAVAISREMFAESSLLVLQEFLPTAFDWRIGVLAGKPLYACRYYMAGGHWQILQEVSAGSYREGRVEAVPLEDAPGAVLDVALRATEPIGNGLYGVDLKETDAGPVVMEVNDNPDIHVGYEDRAEGDAIYETLIDELVRRIRASHRAMSR